MAYDESSLGNASEGNNFNDFTVFFTDFVSLLLDGCTRIVSSLWFEFFFFFGGEGIPNFFEGRGKSPQICLE